MADLKAMVTETQQNKAEFAQRKQAERDTLFTQRDESIVEITSDPAAYLAYLDLQAVNPAVSPANLALVRAAKPDAGMVATMNRWNNLGRSVNKGESGIKIMVPKKYRDGRGVMRTGFDVGRVFDASQTHGDRLPPPVRLAEGTDQMDKAIHTLVSASPVPIAVLDDFVDGSFYDAQEQKILIGGDLSDSAQLAAMVREIAHTRLHAAYGADYSRELCTTDADSVAYLVCKRFGVEVAPPALDDLDALYADLPVGERRSALEYNQELSKSLIDRVEQELNPRRDPPAKEQEVTK